MIITCPNCGARYRLAATAIADNARMRCAACDHRWVVGAEEPEELPVVAPEPEPEPEAPAVDQPIEDLAEIDDEAPQPAVMRTIVAVVLGAALAIGAAAVWVARIDAAQMPVIGSELAALVPGTLPLDVVFTAQTAALPSGDRLLEIKGRVRNTGKAVVTLPDLEARLAGPGGTVRRWRIAAPAAKLAPGGSVLFASTATGFPPEATIVGIRPAG